MKDNAKALLSVPRELERAKMNDRRQGSDQDEALAAR